MKVRIATTALALLGGLAALMTPGESHAGDVGYYSGCFESIGIPAAITAAGHTPVAVSTLDAGSLAPLDGLVIMCGNYSLNAAVNTAVANGMGLFLEQQFVPANAGAALPGAPALVVNTYTTNSVFFCPTDANPAPGSPVTTGPGGALTIASLDGTTGACTPMGYATSASLPSGSIPLLTTGNASEVGAFSYTHGNGRVIYSISQYVHGNSYWPGARTYLTNSIAWLLSQSSGPITTCASEGYTGTKLTWCRNICESDLPQATLDIWIHRWISRYRDLPYCAQEGGGEEEPGPTLK